MQRTKIWEYFNQGRHLLVDSGSLNQHVENKLCGERLYYNFEVDSEGNVVELLFGGKTCLLSSVVAIFLSTNKPCVEHIRLYRSIFHDLLSGRKYSEDEVREHDEFHNFSSWFSDLKDLRRISCLLLPFNIV